MAHGDARAGKWRENWRMEWAASTLHITSEHGVSSISTADAHTSAVSSRLNWRPCRFKWTRPFRIKTEIWFLRACHHISTGLYLQFLISPMHSSAPQPQQEPSRTDPFVSPSSCCTFFSLVLLHSRPAKGCQTPCRPLNYMWSCHSSSYTIWPELMCSSGTFNDAFSC